MLEMAKRDPDIVRIEQIEKEANSRYRTACRGCVRAAALIKDLKTHLES